MSGPLFTSDAFTPDEVVGAGFPIVTRDVTLTNLGGTGALARGTVLGMVTADGRYGISLSAAVDGSQTPRAVLLADADPSGGDVTATILETGVVNAGRLTIGAAHTAASITEPLRALGIFVRSAVAR